MNGHERDRLGRTRPTRHVAPLWSDEEGQASWVDPLLSNEPPELDRPYVSTAFAGELAGGAQGSSRP
jgi:hypothetical protein